MKRSLRIERLARRDEKIIIKRIIYLSLFSLILAIFLFTLGLPLLGKFADLLETIFKKNEQSQVADKSQPQPPRIDPLPEATNSAKLTVSGFSTSGTSVDLYLDDSKLDSIDLTSGRFVFENVFLKNGENLIKVKVVNNSGTESEFSQTETVILDTEAPFLEIENPFDGQSFSGNNRIKVLGKTEKDASVYVNGFLASVDTEGKFEISVPVGEGESSIEIKAIDEAGNVKIETRKVNFRK